MKLQTKLLAALLSTMSLAGACIFLLARHSTNAILLEGVYREGLPRLGALSVKMSAGPRGRDEKSLLPLLNAAASQTRAVYAVALDSSGVVLAHTNVIEKGKKYDDPVTRWALALDKPGFEETEVQGRQLLDVAMPVWESEDDFLLSQEKGGKTRAGSIRLGLPLEEARATRGQILRQIAFILLATGAGNVLIVFLVFRKSLRPLGELALLAEKIGSGQRDVRVPVTTQDEIGLLATSFNRMVDNLKRTTVSRDYMDNIVRSMVDGLLVLEPDGRIKSINRAGLDLSGYQESELLGQSVEAILEGEGSFTAVALEKLLQEGSLKDYESFFKAKSGEKIPILLSGSIMNGDGGKLEGVVVLAKDIRERKKMEMMLVQSEKLSAVGQLAAGVAHEINNPLGIILGFAQSAAKKIQASDALELPIRSIEREALRCKNLVQNLLAFSRQSKSYVEQFDLDEAVESTLGIIEAQARVKSVEIFKELGAPGPLVGDKNQLQQVVVNLCNNAIDAMPAGGRITVRTRGAAADRTVLEVEDTGSGIPEEIQDKIFNPFFTTKEVGKGTGLGLSLVYEIVQRHGGTIRLASAAGRGTTFTVFFPAAGGPHAP